jgi:iron complex transport system ATP-binding protein
MRRKNHACMHAVSLERASIWTPERKLILDRIDWRVEAGEHWVILGPNGAGKTTLLSLIGADRHPSQGSVTILGETLGKTDMRALRVRIGRVDPSLRILEWLNAREVVLTGLRNTIWPQWDGWTDADITHANDLLALVGCRDFAEREISTLSHGERQRIRIARALIARPDLMLLDEPATGLDFPAREALLSSLDTLASTRPDLPTIMVSHHLEDLPSSATHVLLLRGGRVLSSGPIREMLRSELISECFGFAIDVHELEGRWAARASAGWTVSLT